MIGHLSQYRYKPRSISPKMKDEDFMNRRIPDLSIEGFPPDWDTLQSIYGGFVPRPEFHRDSLEKMLARILRDSSWDKLVAEFTKPDLGLYQDMVQRLFYRSCVGFYRSFDLFLAYLAISRYSFRTWSNVTGYYSRFYFVQAWLNLLQCSWVDLKKVTSSIPELSRPPGSSREFFTYNVGTNLRIASRSKLREVVYPQGANFASSHLVWWTLFNSLRDLEWSGRFQDLDYVLAPFYFNPTERNQANYSFEYLEGFVELEWFDQSTNQMLAHFLPTPRPDMDFTNMSRYFAQEDPESVDVGDFYSDPVQIIWISTVSYLRLLQDLDISQDFITREKLDSLIDVHGIRTLFPNIAKGISKELGKLFNE